MEVVKCVGIGMVVFEGFLIWDASKRSLVKNKFPR